MMTYSQKLRARVGERGVVTDPGELEPYNSDWRHLFRGRALCAVLPRTTLELVEVVKSCAAEGVAMVPHGRNTGLSGGATPDGSGSQVVVSLARMNAVRNIDVVGETMEVEAGCILQTAQEAAHGAGLQLPISLAAQGSARIGGIVSTNAGGINVLRYGMSRTRVLGLEVVTADGQIVNGLRRLRKDNAGFDWKQWFIGTEGTLGIVTAAVFALAPRMRHWVTAWVTVSTPEAAIFVAARQAIGETLDAFELLSGPALELVERHHHLRAPLGARPWQLLIEASSSFTGLRDAAELLLADAIERGDAVNAVIAESERHRSDIEANSGRCVSPSPKPKAGRGDRSSTMCPSRFLQFPSSWQTPSAP